MEFASIPAIIIVIVVVFKFWRTMSECARGCESTARSWRQSTELEARRESTKKIDSMKTRFPNGILSFDEIDEILESGWKPSSSTSQTSQQGNQSNSSNPVNP